MLIVNRV